MSMFMLLVLQIEVLENAVRVQGPREDRAPSPRCRCRSGRASAILPRADRPPRALNAMMSLFLRSRMINRRAGLLAS
jgi:hypothetical protein